MKGTNRFMRILVLVLVVAMALGRVAWVLAAGEEGKEAKIKGEVLSLSQQEGSVTVRAEDGKEIKFSAAPALLEGIQAGQKVEVTCVLENQVPVAKAIQVAE